MISLATCIFTVICYWMIYEKLGLNGWKCLIPFYNTYALCKRLKQTSIFVILLISELAFVVGAVWMMNTALGGMFGISDFGSVAGRVTVSGILIPVILMTASAIAMLVCSIMIYVKLSQTFNTGGAFAVGLVFLTAIFLGILALDSRIQAVDNVTENAAPENSSEVGVQPAEEVKNAAPADETAFNEPAAGEGKKICPYCKAEIDQNAEKCPYCRAELSQ